MDARRNAVLLPPRFARVFRGRAHDRFDKNRQKFCEALSREFAPQTIATMAKFEHKAYMPTVIPDLASTVTRDASDLPDEVALVFYHSEDEYNEARRIGPNHSAYFGGCRSQFPVEWQHKLSNHAAYCLDGNTDWSVGSSLVSLGLFSHFSPPEQAVDEIVRRLRDNVNGVFDSAIFAIDWPCLCLWLHIPEGKSEDACTAAEGLFSSELEHVWHQTSRRVAARDVIFNPGDFLDVQFNSSSCLARPKARACLLPMDAKGPGVAANVVLNEAHDCDFEFEYDGFAAARVGGRSYVFAQSFSRREVDVYVAAENGKTLERVQTCANLAGTVAPVVMTSGELQYLLTYDGKTGKFSLTEFTRESSGSPTLTLLSIESPAGNRRTEGFTTVVPFQYSHRRFHGAERHSYLLCYDRCSGIVRVYQFRGPPPATSSNPDRAATFTPGTEARIAYSWDPLGELWMSQWAPGWTRFGFFRMGAENFFIKSNPQNAPYHASDNLGPDCRTDIDCMACDPVVFSHFFHSEALRKNLVDLTCVEVATAPHFVTIDENGLVEVRRFHGNGEGWIDCSRFELQAMGKAVVAIPLANRKVVLLVYGIAAG